ncbi:MAG: hypothetical protein ACI82A_000870 [Candidatus Azotimanducaceae bacterium]|jgi:hypothetical protein
MKTLLIIILVGAALLWVMRLMRRREIEKFRDADMAMLAELKKDVPDAPSAPYSLPLQPLSELGSIPVTPSERAPSTSLLSALETPVLKSIILNERQRRLLEMLESMLVSRYRVFVNLALSDLMTTSSAQRVSFVVCDGHYLSVESALEFEDQLHATVKEHFAVTGKPLVILSDSETETSLMAKLREVGVGLVQVATEKQRCPKCDGDMKFKAPTSGKNAGKRYWLCCAYPQCRGVRPA